MSDLVAFFHLVEQLRSMDLAALMDRCGSGGEDTALWRLLSDIKDALELHEQLTRAA